MAHSTPILDLGNDFYSAVEGGQYTNPILRYRNQKSATLIGLERLSKDQWVKHFGSFLPIQNNLKTPLAMKYHGHQFQQYNSELGDGRGFVFAQFLKNSHLFELGTKGSGTTPYSRRGDGRLTLKGAVRELLATDFLEKQKVLTSQTFSIIETDEKLQRHDEPSPTRSAILFRLSRGHIRIGNFQHALFHQKSENIFKLIDYSLNYFYPELTIPESAKEKVELFFKSVTLRMADLCASYMVAGFVHGVLNTDNMNISGESFDYGPYRFLPYYDPYFTAAYFDHEGLYCFGRQPPTFLWNLDQLRRTLLYAQPDADLANLENEFALQFNVFFAARFLSKTNLKPSSNSLPNSLLSLAPDYYGNDYFPILNVTKIDALSLADLTKSNIFEKTQALIDNFFQDLSQNKSKDFETAFFELLNWTQNHTPTSYFTEDTLNLIAKNFEPIKKLSPSQIQIRKQNLVIDEIEKIWSDIELKDDWSLLYSRLDYKN